jgi:putative transposase
LIRSAKNGDFSGYIFNWRKKYGGLWVSELRRIRQIEEENNQLKKLVANLCLDKQMLQDVIEKRFETFIPRTGQVQNVPLGTS